jgi:starch synthase (maltosyl-transferring)
VFISLDHHNAQRGTVQLPYYDLEIGAHDQFQIRDILPDVSYTWNAEWNFVELHPNMPFHIFEIIK